MLPSASVRHYQESQAIRSSAVREVRAQWRRMGEDFDLSWQTAGPRITATIEQAQAYSAASAVEYAVAEGTEVGVPLQLAGRVNVAAFAGATPSGGVVSAAARHAVVEAKQQVAQGVTAQQALRGGELFLRRLTLDSITGASSDALSAAIASSPPTTGFVRMLNPPSCPDCLLLAGKWFRWNEGFERHPGCDCRHVPARESMTELRTDPYEYFHRLSEREQNALFGEVDAQAIRDGADMYRVRNVRNRGASTGHTWQARRYDSPTVTIDDILVQSHGNRGRAIELMAEHGFILPEGQVSGGAVLGNRGGSPWGWSAGVMGRGGTRPGATQSYRDAVQSGTRDILNPATQTAGERRFHQSYLAHEAAVAGRNPFGNRLLTAKERELIDRQWREQLAFLNSGREGAAQVRALAIKLGVL